MKMKTSMKTRRMRRKKRMMTRKEKMQLPLQLACWWKDHWPTKKTKRMMIMNRVKEQKRKMMKIFLLMKMEISPK
jgi:hypothetical protein